MAQSSMPPSKFLQKQIPTLLGVLLLVAGLGVGIFFFSDGLGVFAPRAAPETTPRNVKVTNVTDTGFSVSFLTDSDTPGYIRYGTSATEIKSRAGDDRDQLSGSIGEYRLHHISVRDLSPGATYYFTLGTTGSTEYDNEGAPFSVTTAPKAGTAPAAKTIYGSVVSSGGAPAEGSVVYVTLPGAGQLSSLVKSSGSWAIPLATARDTATGQFATLDDTTTVEILVQSPSASLTSQVNATVGTAQPVATITLGNSSAATTTQSEEIPVASNEGSETTGNAVTPEPPLDMMADDEMVEDDAVGGVAAPAASASATTTSSRLSTVPSPTPNGAVVEENVVVDLTTSTKETVTTTQPVIVGTAKPGVTITVQVNSETQINDQIIADEDGEFEIDISQYAADLEPGEHTVTYSYIDPTTGQTVTKSKNFTVAATAQPQVETTATTTRSSTSTQLAQANTRPTPSPTPRATATPAAAPFSTTNPYPIGGTTATRSATATPSATATRSAQTATTSALPRSGSLSTTMALILGGMFFLIAGSWSFWASREWQKELV